MAINVSERASALNDVLAMLRAQAQAIAEDRDLDPRHDLTDRVYTAGQLTAIAQAAATVGGMLDDLWATDTGTAT